MSDVTIRPYRAGDRGAILRITDESFAGFCLDANIEAHFGPIAETNWKQRKRDSIKYDLRCNREHVLVAERDGRVVGYVCTRLYREQEMGHVANLAVAREEQRRGIGRVLLKAALDHFRRSGMCFARLETLEQNYKGRKLYPACGFKEVGRQIFYMREV